MVKRRLVAAAVVLGFLAGGVVLAGDGQTSKPEQPQWLFVSFVKVNPGAMAEYTDVQIKEVMPAQQKGGALGRQAWGTGIAGTPREIVYMSPIDNFSRFDNPPPMRTALGAEGAAAVNAKVIKLAETTRTMLARTRPDLSWTSDPNASPVLALVTVVSVIPGKAMDFENLIKKDVLPAMQKAKAKSYFVMEVVYGDATNTYITAVGYDNYEAIGKGHPFQIALGDDGVRKLDMKVSGMLSRVERFISRHRPDLSWAPKAGSE